MLDTMLKVISARRVCEKRKRDKSERKTLAGISTKMGDHRLCVKWMTRDLRQIGRLENQRIGKLSMLESISGLPMAGSLTELRLSPNDCCTWRGKDL